ATGLLHARLGGRVAVHPAARGTGPAGGGAGAWKTALRRGCNWAPASTRRAVRSGRPRDGQGSVSWSLLSQATAQEGSASPMPRAMLVFAHPDDEVVGLGARLGRFRSACFVHVTD